MRLPAEWAAARALAGPQALARAVLDHLAPDAPRPAPLPAAAPLDPAPLLAALPGEPLDAFAALWPALLDDAAGAPGGARRRAGAYYTPDALALALLRASVDGVPVPADAPPISVWDPACGSGAFLCAAAEAARAGALPPIGQLVGHDPDPVALALAAARLLRRGFGGARLVCADALGPSAASPAPGTVGLVVGNPPFSGQLRGGGVRGRGAAAVLRARFGGALGGYADAAAAFLLLAHEALAPGGRLLFVLPRSLAAARDAAPVRAALAPRGLRALWAGDGADFGASIPVLAVAFGPAPGPVQLLRGAAPVVRVAAAEGPGADWARALAVAEGVPDPGPGAAADFDEVATFTADFREVFYALAAVLVEDGPGTSDDAAFPPVLTTAHVAPGRLDWGARPVRIGGQRWVAPRADLSRAPEALRAWAARVRVPKVIIAPQTRVIEAAADPTGRFLPLTPLIRAVPRSPALSPGALAGALLHPATAARLARACAGSGRGPGVLRPSAAALRALPLPVGLSALPSLAAWAAALAGPSRGLDAAVAAGGPPGAGPALAWWRARLRGVDGVAPASPAD